MYRRYLIPTLNSVAKTVQPEFSPKNFYKPKHSITKDASFCRPFATSLPENSTEKLENVTYENVNSFVNDKNVVIIDVREPNELIEYGVLPGSINIPCKVEGALKSMSNEQFLKQYGHIKPDEETPVVFSCMKGVRSEKAQIIALQLGYKNVKNYLGGWVDWAEKSKK